MERVRKVMKEGRRSKFAEAARVRKAMKDASWASFNRRFAEQERVRKMLKYRNRMYTCEQWYIQKNLKRRPT